MNKNKFSNQNKLNSLKLSKVNNNPQDKNNKI